MKHETLIDLVADIVSAHVSNNHVPASDMPILITGVYASLANIGRPAPEPAPAASQAPAVSIRASVQPEAITCLECGQKKTMLKRHLRTHHGLSTDAYRTKWKLGSSYPLVAPNYAAMRKDMALKIGLGRLPGTGRKRGRAKGVAAA